MDRTFKLCQLLAVCCLLVCKTSAEPPTDDKDLDDLIKEIFNIPNDQPGTTVTQASPTVPPTDTRYPLNPPSPTPPEDTHHTYQPQPPPPTKPHPQPHESTPSTNPNTENEPNVS